MTEHELLPLREAAERLGVSVDALRARIRRGKIQSVRGNDGMVRVYVNPDERLGETASQSPKRLGEHLGELPSQIRHIEAHLETLKEQLDREREAHERTRAELVEERRKSQALADRTEEVRLGARADAVKGG